MAEPLTAKTCTLTAAVSGLERTVVAGITPDGLPGVSGGNTSGGNSSFEFCTFRGSGNGIGGSGSFPAGAGEGTALGSGGSIGFASEPGNGGITKGGVFGTIGSGIVFSGAGAGIGAAIPPLAGLTIGSDSGFTTDGGEPGITVTTGGELGTGAACTFGTVAGGMFW